MTFEDRRGDFDAVARPLWSRAAAGDEQAYRSLLQLVARRLRAQLRRRLVDRPADLEDVVQDTLLALHLQRGAYDPALPLSAWVLAIARHKLVDHWRRHGRHDVARVALDDLGDDEPAQPPVDPGTPRDLERLLGLLPAAQQRAIRLTKLQGLSVAEAARQTGASESAIKVQVHRGLRLLAGVVRGKA